MCPFVPKWWDHKNEWPQERMEFVAFSMYIVSNSLVGLACLVCLCWGGSPRERKTHKTPQVNRGCHGGRDAEACLMESRSMSIWRTEAELRSSRKVSGLIFVVRPVGCFVNHHGSHLTLWHDEVEVSWNISWMKIAPLWAYSLCQSFLSLYKEN